MRWIHLGVCDASAVGEAARSPERRVSGRRVFDVSYSAQSELGDSTRELYVRPVCSMAVVVQLLKGVARHQRELMFIAMFGGKYARKSKANAVKLCRHVLRPCISSLYRRAG
jgi:hypothetical protein